MDRRRYLQAVATGGSLALAGCLGILDGGGGDGDGGSPATESTPAGTASVTLGDQDQTPTRTDAPTPTATERVTKTPTATPTPTPAPAEPLQAEPRVEPVTFSGGELDGEVVGTVSVTPGPAIGDYRYNEGELSVDAGPYSFGDDACDCSELDYATSEGDYDVLIQADSDWEVTIYQPAIPSPSGRPLERLPAEGTGNAVLGPFYFSGEYLIDGPRDDYPLHSIRIQVPKDDGSIAKKHVVGPGDWPPEFSHDGVAWIEVNWIHVDVDAGWYFTIERQ